MGAARLATAAIVLVALASPAQAYLCMPAFIYRVKLDQCVAITSPLAHGYVHQHQARRSPPATVAHAPMPSRAPSLAPSPWLDQPSVGALRKRFTAPARLEPADILLSRAKALGAAAH